MKLIIKPAKNLKGEVEAPPSKSYTHRAIILASLARGESKIYNPLLSADTFASIDACKAIGAKVVIDEKNNCLIINGNPELDVPKTIIDVKNSGTTIRLMTSVLSLCDKKVTLTGDSSIQKRPMQPLLDALRELGVKTESDNGTPPVSVTGPMRGGKCQIRGDVSSQFISGLLISSPMSGNDTTIEIMKSLKSKPYLKMTLHLVEQFGVEIENRNYKKFFINGGQEYLAGNYDVEGDYSSAAFILGAGALTDSEIKIKNLLNNSKQGDKIFLDILEKMGAEIEIYEDYVIIKGSGKLNGIEIDLSQYPDLVPVVAALAALSRGKTTIKNIEHVRYKESDRVHAIATELKKMGARVTELKASLEIQGVEKLKGAEVCGWNDHRIVMALAVAALRAEGKTVIDAAETIDVSFPDFHGVMKELGVEIEVE
ncbi:3-phosphoshikimate 1-carboxyvinyltransferase [Candidatus Altiarchaeales archaeon WOR_SM1_SCG]|nr:MAG: 3-phosphoshikimate 1-carboxyvinyltransferase [Candidatus Altiarchaeales archaeon WOR_SM1_79]ODS40671.1 3-phosphoshikimate 1-carboxyvinyltransferase [Candidatus Altiarchaeales archaeon WOR_SM1_SCG]